MLKYVDVMNMGTIVNTRKRETKVYNRFLLNALLSNYLFIFLIHVIFREK